MQDKNKFGFIFVIALVVAGCAAQRFPDANGDEWIRRAALDVSVNKWGEAAQSLTLIAKKWPKALNDDNNYGRLVGRVVIELGKQPALRQRRLELLNALFESGFKATYDTEPSWLWRILVTDAVERKDLKRAREILRQITGSSTLIEMCVDRRFDPLMSEDPKNCDVLAAAEREATHMKNAMKENPKKLSAASLYSYDLYRLGRFEELLALTEGIIAKVEKAPKDEPPYEDMNTTLNWIYDHKARALRALGKWEEAAAVLADWQRGALNRTDKVSQAINLGFAYNALGRPDEALKAVQGLDGSPSMSPYGRMQFQLVQFRALTQLGQESEADKIAAWMLERQNDSPRTVQSVLLESGDVDGAAALLLSRLRDVDERSNVLAEIQSYAQIPRTEYERKLGTQREALLARPDVVAAIAKYGRRETFPVYSVQ